MPFGNFTFTVTRLVWDVFGPGFPPSIVTAPYRITVSTIGRLRVAASRYDRASGHLDLSCTAEIGWTAVGGPPAWLHGAYGLDFRTSYYSGLLTTRTVERTIPPLGPTFAGSPLDLSRTPPQLTLVSSGTLTDGFGPGAPCTSRSRASWGAASPSGRDSACRGGRGGLSVEVGH